MIRRTFARPTATALVFLFGVTALTFSLIRQSGAAEAAPPKPPVVFETKVTCCQTIVLSSGGTLIATSPALPVGTYLVHATVGVVIGPNDGHVTCATAPTSVGGNDGIFGYAGNGATESGSGPDGVYGSATIVDTWTITQPGDTIYLYCWVGNFGQGTYASEAVLAVERLGTLIQ